MFLTSATGEGRCVSNGFPDYVGRRVHINAQFITDNYEYHSGTYQYPIYHEYHLVTYQCPIYHQRL